MINLIIALSASLIFVIPYRLIRHRSIMPRATEDSVAAAWLKILVIMFVVTVGLWIVLTLVQGFPD